MKVLLVNPPRSLYNGIYDHASPAAQRFIHRKLIGPPLGLLTIAAAIKPYHDVELLELKAAMDLSSEVLPQTQLIEAMERFQPDVIGITVIASEFDASMDLLAAAKKIDPHVLTIAGGLHATLCPLDFSKTSTDVVCVGQATKIFLKLLDRIQNNLPFDDLAGIYYQKDNALISGKVAATTIDPAGTDFLVPDRSLIEKWHQAYYVGGKGPVTYLFTSLGCPFSCSFCTIWKQHLGMFHQRTVDSIIAELKILQAYPAVRFADANTLVNPKFLEELFLRISSEGIKKEFIMDIRPDTAVEYPELIRTMAKGGLRIVICGFESFRHNELARYNKSYPIEAIDEAIKIFHDNGVSLRGNYVVPPSYNNDDFAAMGEFASRNPVAYAGYTILTPMPGSDFYADVRRDIVDHNLARYNFFNCVLPTTLPLERFYEAVADLWLVRKGDSVI